MSHCHMLLHEDEGMMGQFLVVEPGDAVEPGTPGQRSHDH
ncbi:multicopper oxidase domain-containing protein [Myceligenerans salitolerans]|nr:multicopper oxidase domain-containing protein [Myceligenerans salitolerans]